MNQLPPHLRARILNMLVEGSSLRSTARVNGVAVNTVLKLFVDAGTACAQYHDKHVRGIQGRRHIQLDEIWAFCHTKIAHLTEQSPEGAGDVWTWTALDAGSKLLVSWVVGSREAQYAETLARDLRTRLVDEPHIVSDGYYVYEEAIIGAFGRDVDYERTVGTHASTSLVERQNLTMRMSMRRFTRKTNAFSKKFQNHVHSVSLHSVWYNWCRPHQTLKGATPAMAAGLTDYPRDVQWIVDELL